MPFVLNAVSTGWLRYYGTTTLAVADISQQRLLHILPQLIIIELHSYRPAPCSLTPVSTSQQMSSSNKFAANVVATLRNRFG